MLKRGKVMATKNQHYVPLVYVKAWETMVYSIREPQKPFTGVYHYKKNNLKIGDGRNKSTILANNHTYTIGYDYAFLIPKCPEIRKDLACKIQNILRERKVIAKYKTKSLINTKVITEYLPFLDDWDFVDISNNPVKKKTIINSIKEIRSYCLEDRFSSYMESNWENTVNSFLYIRQNGQKTTLYCDSFGFSEAPEFLKPENYLKNAEIAVEDDYGMVDGIINNGRKEVTPPGMDEW